MASYFCGLWHCLQRQEVKKGILKFAKDFTGKLVGEGGACSMLCGQHKVCYSRAVGVWKETRSAVSATARHKHVSKLPQICSVCFLLPYHSTEMTGSGAPTRDFLRLLSGPWGQHQGQEYDGPWLEICRKLLGYSQSIKMFTSKEQGRVTATQAQKMCSHCAGV